MTCERCQGDGRVISYRGTPLWLGLWSGKKRIREVAKLTAETLGELVDMDEISDEDALKAVLLVKDARDCTYETWAPVPCPDCAVAA